MNPWAIVGVLLALAAAYLGGDYRGHGRGLNEQKVADQGQFDQVNRERTQQQADAAELLRAAAAGNMLLTEQRDALKTQLGELREKDRVATDTNRQRFAGLGLRFRAPQGDASGQGGAGAPSSPDRPSGPASGPTVELPSSIASDLRQLTFEADTLADAYRECKGYVDLVR